MARGMTDEHIAKLAVNPTKQRDVNIPTSPGLQIRISPGGRKFWSLRYQEPSGKQKRKFKVTTDSSHNNPVTPNILGGMASPSSENEIWVTDITYLWTREGWVYLAAIMDLYSRRIVNWTAGPRMTVDLVSQALQQALALRGPVPGLVHHSDRGSQYCSKAYRKQLTDARIICSMSRKGNCWDNAAMESFWHSLKVEWLFDFDFVTRWEAVQEVRQYIDGFYNRDRRHSSLGDISPEAFERASNGGP